MPHGVLLQRGFEETLCAVPQAIADQLDTIMHNYLLLHYLPLPPASAAALLLLLASWVVFVSCCAPLLSSSVPSPTRSASVLHRSTINDGEEAV